jgi:bacillolysin/thermolysin
MWAVFATGSVAAPTSAGTAFLVDENLTSQLQLWDVDAMAADPPRAETARSLKEAIRIAAVPGAVPVQDRIGIIQSKMKPVGSLESPVTAAQRNQLLRLIEDAPDAQALQVVFDKQNGTPTFVKLKTFFGRSGQRRQASAVLTDTLARRFLRTHQELLKLKDPDQDLALEASWSDRQGARHFKYQQVVHGIPVYGKQLIVHVDDADAVYLLNGRYEPAPDGLDTTPAISRAEALEAVQAHLGLPGIDADTIDLVVFTQPDGAMLLTYRLEVTLKLSEAWTYFIDAMDATIVHRMTRIHNDVVSASGMDLNGVQQSFKTWLQGDNYYLIDLSMPSAGIPGADPVAAVQNPGNTYVITANNGDGSNLYHITSTSSTSGWDAAGVSVMASIEKSYNFYKTNFNRDGLDGDGRNYMGVVHLGQNYANAFWNGTYIVFGDGDNKTFSSLAASLDIAAHELQHGITEFTANLKYENQSGALNEAYSDLFACMVDDANWTVGEDCTLLSPGYLRNLADPTKGLSSLPRNMSEYRNLPNTEEGDWGGVHINMSIGSRAGYLMAEGLDSSSIGREKTAAIWYRALTTYLTPYAQFADARSTMTQAAEDLYGAASAEVAAVQAAWDMVEVFATGSTRPTPGDPVSGDDVMLYLYPLDGTHNPYAAGEHYHLCALLNAGSGYDEANDIYPLNDTSSDANRPRYTKTAAYTDASGATVIFYATETHNLHAAYLYSDGSYDSGQEVIGTGDFYSIALSPDGRYFAYTRPEADDNHIYVLDLDGDRTGAFVIEPFSDAQQKTNYFNTILYADSLAFDFASKTLAFDALNCISTADSSCFEGEGFRYWSIGFLSLADDPNDASAVQGTLSFPFPNQSPQYDVSYPAFAANNSFVLALDFNDYSTYSTSGSIDSMVLTLNGRDGESRWVINPDRSDAQIGVYGVPTFWGDDDAITIQWYNGDNGSADRVPIDGNWAGPADKEYQGSGAITSLNDYDVAMPVMHRLASRAVSGVITFSTDNLNFDNVAVGSQATKNITLSNASARDIRILNIALSGAARFSHNGTNGLLPRSGQVVITVAYTPTAAGSESATLSITSDADVPTNLISISGRATSSSSDDGGGGGGGGGCMISGLGDGPTQGMGSLILTAFLTGLLIVCFLLRARFYAWPT